MNVIAILIRLAFSAGVYFLPDILLHPAIKKGWGKKISRLYWWVNIGLFVAISISSFLIRDSSLLMQRIQLLFLGLFVAILFAKVFVSVLLMAELFCRSMYSLFTQRKRAQENPKASKLVSRRQFLAKGIILTGLLPFSGMLYGMVRGRFRYTLHEIEVALHNLPPAFDGFTITQLSDIHIGSFEKGAMDEISHMVQMVNELQSDAIFFTGDIVNSRADEMDGWYNILEQFKARVARLSVLGNHDYGDYVDWPNEAAKTENLNQVKAMHAKLGFTLLLNERTFIEKDGQRLEIIGIENWGNGDFPKLGDLQKAATGLQKEDCMILLSHDPSFWEEHVLTSDLHPELTLSGHTHGFQMGIETPAFRFSPSQWIYKQWAGLYSEGKQHIYVNRGIGTVGYPGRLGIWPEVTKITLRKG